MSILSSITCGDLDAVKEFLWMPSTCYENRCQGANA